MNRQDWPRGLRGGVRGIYTTYSKGRMTSTSRGLGEVDGLSIGLGRKDTLTSEDRGQWHATGEFRVGEIAEGQCHQPRWQRLRGGWMSLGRGGCVRGCALDADTTFQALRRGRSVWSVGRRRDDVNSRHTSGVPAVARCGNAGPSCSLRSENVPKFRQTGPLCLTFKLSSTNVSRRPIQGFPRWRHPRCQPSRPTVCFHPAIMR